MLSASEPFAFWKDLRTVCLRAGSFRLVAVVTRRQTDISIGTLSCGLECGKKPLLASGHNPKILAVYISWRTNLVIFKTKAE